MTDPTPAPREWLNIEIDHSSYYRWVPIAEGDVFDDTADEAGVRPAVPEGKTALSVTVGSTFPGFRMQRVIVQESTTSTCNVFLPDLEGWNNDREAAGLTRRPHQLNLVQHLSDGPWPKQFPLDSITAIRADDPTWENQLGSVFVSAPAAPAASAPPVEAAPAPVAEPIPDVAPEATP